MSLNIFKVRRVEGGDVAIALDFFIHKYHWTEFIRFKNKLFNI